MAILVLKRLSVHVLHPAVKDNRLLPYNRSKANLQPPVASLMRPLMTDAMVFGS